MNEALLALFDSNNTGGSQATCCSGLIPKLGHGLKGPELLQLHIHPWIVWLRWDGADLLVGLYVFVFITSIDLVDNCCGIFGLWWSRRPELSR